MDGQWYTRDDLARAIRGMLDSGNFAVAKPSHALEQLNELIGNLRTLAVRVPPELAENLNAAATAQGRPVGALVREAIFNYLGVGAAGEEPALVGSGPDAAEMPPAEVHEPVVETPTAVPTSVQIPADSAALSVARVNELRPSTADRSVPLGDNLPSVLVNLDEPPTGGEGKKEEASERRWFSGTIRP